MKIKNKWFAALLLLTVTGGIAIGQRFPDDGREPYAVTGSYTIGVDIPADGDPIYDYYRGVMTEIDVDGNGSVIWDERIEPGQEIRIPVTNHAENTMFQYRFTIYDFCRNNDGGADGDDWIVYDVTPPPSGGCKPYIIPGPIE